MDKINNNILLFFSIFVTLTYTIFRNAFSKKYVKSNADYFLFNSVSCIISTVVLFLIAGCKFTPSRYTILLGIGFGAISTIAAITMLYALKIGPLSYTTLIVTFASIIPTLSGKLFWNEEVRIWQYFGIILMFISMAMTVEKNPDNKEVSFRWLLLCICAFISNGFVGIMQKVHQSSAYKEELNEYLITAFAVSVLFSSAAYFICRHREGKDNRMSIALNKTAGGIAILSGLCIALANWINLYLAGRMDSAIFFPVVNGAGLILAAIAAAVLFKEKLSKKRSIGLIIGIISVLFLCIN